MDFMQAIGVIISVLILIIVISLVMSLPVMFLWNWLMPAIFGLAKIGWLQSFGLLLLSGFLFKNTSNSKSS